MCMFCILLFLNFILSVNTVVSKIVSVDKLTLYGLPKDASNGDLVYFIKYTLQTLFVHSRYTKIY